MIETKWFAVYTRPRWEKKVAELLGKRKIEHYCPLNRVQKQWSDRKKVVFEPLFTSYVFVNIADTQQMPVLQTPGIINFVYWLGKPAIIRNEEITTIKQFLNEYTNVRLEKTQVNLNDHVRIINGPLMMRKGNIVEVRNSTVKVMLPSLGHALIAEVRKENVEKLVLAEAMKVRV
ncbi:MAG TPA: UpxY family transcription antiterminator [Chitinophagaceae bacterium]|nr:UpxY family transcription antiterminator [Chitinophagaceae bacterium]